MIKMNLRYLKIVLEVGFEIPYSYPDLKKIAQQKFIFNDRICLYFLWKVSKFI
jgi:hypothetical protein